MKLDSMLGDKIFFTNVPYFTFSEIELYKSVIQMYMAIPVRIRVKPKKTHEVPF
jgi:hypothetical protein